MANHRWRTVIRSKYNDDKSHAISPRISIMARKATSQVLQHIKDTSNGGTINVLSKPIAYDKSPLPAIKNYNDVSSVIYAGFLALAQLDISRSQRFPIAMIRAALLNGISPQSQAPIMNTNEGQLYAMIHAKAVSRPSIVDAVTRFLCDRQPDITIAQEVVHIMMKIQDNSKMTRQEWVTLAQLLSL